MNVNAVTGRKSDITLAIDKKMGPSLQLNNIWVVVSVHRRLVLPLTYIFTRSPFMFTKL